MMTYTTVRQILDVLKVCYDNQRKGLSLSRSYQDGVREVAHENGVTYQTIGDGCRRRLRLKDINEFYNLLGGWTKGEPSGLIEQLKKNSYSHIHPEILAFFENYQPGQAVAENDATAILPLSKTEVFSVHPANEYLQYS
jgi:hypothetical protein